MRQITLPFSPRDYQLKFIQQSDDLIRSNPEGWHLFSSPTGTGKSYMELMVLSNYPTFILITPRIEIIAGMLEKLGHNVDIPLEKMIELGQSYRIFTPIRLRNILAQGRLLFRPDGIIVDEAHHDLADTYQDIIMYLNYCTKIGLTASPYRGNPRDTKRFREQWGNKVHEIISLKQAIEQGYFALPVPTIWPMIDDDEISVSNGEFQVTGCNREVVNSIDGLINNIKQFYDRRFGYYDRPTMVAVPSTVIVGELVKSLNRNNLPAVGVTQATSRQDRQTAFNDVIKCKVLLVQIGVVSEGVDIPLERIIDCKPTMSPVGWIQQIGRMRVADTPVEYICCCRNIERHGYLMEGYFPNSIYVESDELFKSPSKRSGIRAVGLEGLGKFTTTSVKLLSGVTCSLYNLVTMNGFERIEYCILVHPNHMEQLRAKRTSVVKERTEERTYYDWGKWQLVDSIPDLKGFASAKPTPLTERQRIKYTEQAERYGLNPHVEVNNRNFQVLPLLWNLSEQQRHIVKLT